MKLDGRKWRTLISHVRLGKDTYRVIRPARPLRHARLHEDWCGAQLAVDETAARDLALAWWLAARSPRTLVYLPLRSSEASCGQERGDRKLDLVLLHHSLQFPASRWKNVRARLTSATPHTVELPPDAFPVFGRETHREWTHEGFHDHLRWDIAADTLFLVGSRRAYELEADQMRGLAEDSPAEIAASPGRHCCAEIGIGRDRRNGFDTRRPTGTVHIELCVEHHA